MTLCGERLHHIRTQRGFTQSELAELVGVEQNHISHIESGRRMMSLTLLREIAQTLRVSTDALLFDEAILSNRERSSSPSRTAGSGTNKHRNDCPYLR